MAQTYQRIVLAARPTGWPTPENFRLETVPVPEPVDGQVLVRVHFLSLDPYMRGRMSDAKSYAAPQPLDETMVGGTVGVVERSCHPDFQVGDKVVGTLGWQEYGLAQGHELRKVDDARVPLSVYLGAAGMPGMTAWYGYRKILDPQPGQTLVVSAASGAVGSVVGQLARIHGVRAVGIAGGPEKCRYVTEVLGFDACVDYKQATDVRSLYALLKAVTPDGVDRYFENVGGDGLNAVMARLNDFSRIAICGLISDYNLEPGQMPRSAILNPSLLLTTRSSMQGFIVSDHLEYWAQGLPQLAAWIAEGKIQYRETIAEGLASAPEAFIGLLQGRNFGKQLVRLV